MFDFVFRLDANKVTGGGHLQRALGLIQPLKSLGYQIACTGDITQDYQAILAQQDIKLFPLSAPIETRCLVFDIYGDFDDYIASATELPKLVVFEDLDERQHSQMDLVINAFGDREDLQSRYPSAEVLCGLEYLLFREQVHLLKQHVRDSGKKLSPASILVSLGGADQRHILQPLLKILDKLLILDVQLNVISPNYLDVPKRCSLHIGLVADFLERAAASHLVICGLGQTFLEMQYLGQASIGLLLVENQQTCAQILAKQGLKVIQDLANLEARLIEYLQTDFPGLLSAQHINFKDNRNLTPLWQDHVDTHIQSLLGANKQHLINKMVDLIK